jgi:excisionase family DNA binding protein
MASGAEGEAAVPGGDGLPELLRKEDVARALVVSTRTVERLIASGEFAGGIVRKGGIVRVTRSALEAFVIRHIDPA